MEDWVSRKMNIVEVITVEQDRIVDEEVQILQYSLEPYNFTCSNGHIPIFSLGAQ